MINCYCSQLCTMNKAIYFYPNGKILSYIEENMETQHVVPEAQEEYIILKNEHLSEKNMMKQYYEKDFHKFGYNIKYKYPTDNMSRNKIDGRKINNIINNLLDALSIKL